MKKTMRFFTVLLAVVMVFSIVGSMSVFAARDWEDFPRTPTRYMNGYKLYGYSTLTRSVAMVSTYCENLSYQKRVHMLYLYVTDRGVTVDEWSDDTGYVVNGFDTLSDAFYGSSSRILDGVLGYHWVKASSSMYWSSIDSEECTHVGNLNIVYE